MSRSEESAPSLKQKPWLDVVLGALGLLVGWASLTYPFGRDQGLYYYVAREWVRHGSIPYRDVLDHKTPGIYVVHALAILVFGDHAWAIRILDLVCTALVGLLAATFTVDPGEQPRRGMRGGSIIIISVLFYGFLNFWDTAQSELWYSMLGLASVWAARRIQRVSLAELASGALGALAMIMKPPAIWFVLIAYTVCVTRSWPPEEQRWRRVAITTARFGAGFAIPLVLLFTYSGANHALAPMKDIVIGANSYYVSHETSIHGIYDVVSDVADYYAIYDPLNTAMLVGLLLATAFHHKRGHTVARNRYLLAIAMCTAGFLAVAMQKKFYILHWTVVLGPATIVGSLLCVDVLDFGRSHKWTTWHFAGVVAVLAKLYQLTHGGPETWWYANRNAVRWLTGKIDRAEYADTFCVPQLDFWYGNSERVGLWIREHSNPDDVIAVRGFDAEIYAVAERRYTGRFFWTTFLTSPVRAYRRADWLAEDQAAFNAAKPRYVVALSAIHEGLDAPETYIAQGYETRLVIREFTILERKPSM